MKSYSGSFGEAMFHIVFTPKYRKSIFRSETVASRCEELLREIASKYNFDLVALKVMPDHVHMAIDIGTRYGLGQMAQFMKGISARYLFAEFPELREVLWGGELWNDGYFHRSMGDVRRETAIHYIENQ
jgi:putative transposase